MPGRRNREPPRLECCLRHLTYPTVPDIRNPANRTIWFIGHRSTAEAYARAYYAEHGRLPKGTHRIKPKWGGPEVEITFPVRSHRR